MYYLLIDHNGSKGAIILNHIMSLRGTYYDGNMDMHIIFFKAREALLCTCKKLFLIVSNALRFFFIDRDFKPPMASSLQSVVAEIRVCVRMKKAMPGIYSNGTASP